MLVVCMSRVLAVGIDAGEEATTHCWCNDGRATATCHLLGDLVWTRQGRRFQLTSADFQTVSEMSDFPAFDWSIRYWVFILPSYQTTPIDVKLYCIRPRAGGINCLYSVSLHRNMVL